MTAETTDNWHHACNCGVAHGFSLAVEHFDDCPFGKRLTAMLAAARAEGEAVAASAFVEWAAKNEIAEPPLDWAWFGEIARRYSPLHEMKRPPCSPLSTRSASAV